MTTPAAPPPSGPPTSFGAPRTPTGRLPQGELRRQVAAHLVANPGSHTPGEVARALGSRSAGAVGNALETLVDRGEAELTTTRPRRFHRTSTTADAARGGATASPSPRPTGGRPTQSPRTASPAPAAPAAPGSGTPRTSPAGGAAPVRRPNGQTYHPRLLADLPDVAALQRLRDAQVAALLYGPPGTGKTSLVEAAFPDLITVSGDGDTAVADFVGEYTQADGGGYEFIYGPLIVAMNEGRVLFIDDATLIPPRTLAVVYPAMDGRRQITVKAHTGETITAADGFYVIAGHNPGVHGAVLTEALSSRFAAQIQVTTDYDLARTLKIDSRAVRVARHLATHLDSGVIGWAPQLRELIAFQKISGVLGTSAAVANLIGVAPEEDRDVVVEVIRTVFGRDVAPLALGHQI